MNIYRVSESIYELVDVGEISDALKNSVVFAEYPWGDNGKRNLYKLLERHDAKKITFVGKYSEEMHDEYDVFVDWGDSKYEDWDGYTAWEENGDWEGLIAILMDLDEGEYFYVFCQPQENENAIAFSKMYIAKCSQFL